MNVGEILIRLSFLLCAAATGYAVWHYLSGKASLRNLSRKTELGCLITTTLSVLLLTYYLYSVDLRYVYVFHQSSMDLAWYYRISALLAGIRGSWLFWTWCLLLMLGLMQHTGPSKVLRNAKIMDITRTVTLVIASLFLLLLIIRNPFELSVDVYGIVPTYGMGMNPLLRTPWMVIHPPLFFIGYAAFTIPYAASIGYLILEDSRWVHIAETWSRIAWFFLTLGIGIGGLWAYEVLGWAAWYWSWDPIETSSLVPWVASTAYLHAQFRLKRKEYQFVTPLLAIVTFILVIFATFIVRSGLWASEHAWQEFGLEGKIIAAFILGLIVTSAYLLQKRFRA